MHKRKIYQKTSTVYPFSGRRQGGPRTGPAVALILILEPSFVSISELCPGPIYVTWKYVKLGEKNFR